MKWRCGMISLQCLDMPPHCKKVVGSIPRPWIHSLHSFCVLCVCVFSKASSYSPKTFHTIRLTNSKLSMGADGCFSLYVPMMNRCWLVVTSSSHPPPSTLRLQPLALAPCDCKCRIDGDRKRMDCREIQHKVLHRTGSARMKWCMWLPESSGLRFIWPTSFIQGIRCVLDPLVNTSQSSKRRPLPPSSLPLLPSSLSLSAYLYSLIKFGAHGRRKKNSIMNHPRLAHQSQIKALWSPIQSPWTHTHAQI